MICTIFSFDEVPPAASTRMSTEHEMGMIVGTNEPQTLLAMPSDEENKGHHVILWYVTSLYITVYHFLFTTHSQGSGITFSEASVFNPAADGGAPTWCEGGGPPAAPPDFPPDDGGGPPNMGGLKFKPSSDRSLNEKRKS